MVLLPDGPLSLWLDTYGDYRPEPAVAGHVSADVAVIGGGLTGLATAIHLRRKDPTRSVAVLEGRRVGYGASGRNGSFAMTVTGLGFGTTALLRGKEYLRRAHAYMERCVDELEAFIDVDDLDCDKVRPGFLRVATTPTYVTRLQKQVELMTSLGFDGIEWVDQESTRKRVDSPHYLGAMHEERLLLVNPAKLVREEKRRARELGAEVYEDTPVLSVARGRSAGSDGYRLLTPQGSVAAGQLVFATNAYSHLFPALANKQTPVFTYMIATEPLSDAQLSRLGWSGGEGVEDARNLIHYYRLTPDHRIVLGGGPVGLTAHNALDRDVDVEASRHLEEHLRWLFPQLGDLAVTHRWGGPFSVTLDLTPAVGWVGDDRDAVYALGCVGHGVSMSYLNGRVLSELLDGEEDGLAADCPFVNRRVVPWPPEPLASLGKHAIHGYLRAEDAVHERVLPRVLRA